MHSEAQFRSIRVFVSSTFRDMQEEREELVKRVFPLLRKRCEERGVAWSEVDLRWGVTDEQKAEGAVLPICLAEIDRSRPYFIGLLGQRYGWIPEELPIGLAEQLPWLRALGESKPGTSVTEMEILHGALNDPDAAAHSYFYLRDPAWLATRPAEEQRILGELPTDDEIAALGADAAARAAQVRADRLEDLKRTVRAANMRTWEYPDPRRLGERVLADFSALIDRLYPENQVPDAVMRDAAAHRSFGAAQILGQPARQAVADRLDGYAAGGESGALVLHGEPGAGTGAAATAWLQAWRSEHPDDVIIEHHVGATADAADWSALAGRVVAELSRAHGLENAIFTDPPADSAGRRAACVAAIARAGASTRRTVVLVDGVDLLDDVDGARALTWLPAVLPSSVRVVVTATTGSVTVAEAERRGWSVCAVPALDEAEKRDLITTFLRRWSKGLDEAHVATIVATPATGNTLFLRTLLDELRQHGDHFTLGDVIQHYLAATSLDALLGLVLARYEHDFERDRVGLVGDAMRCLWAARRGLSEPELLEILGTPGSPLPSAAWSPLVLAAEAGLVTASGQLVFATEPHRRAVEQRYLPTVESRAAAHRALAQAFARHQLGPRVVEELPWQQLAAGDVDGLFATLCDLRFTDAAYRQSHSDLRRLWRRVEEAGRRVVDGYADLIADPARDPEMSWEVARLVTDAGYPTESARLNRFLTEHSRRGAAAGDEAAQRRLPAALVNLGVALMGQGELAAAEPVLQEAINLSRARNDLTVLQAALGDLALARRDRGDLDGALPLFAEEEAMCRRARDTVGLQASLGNRAALLRQRGDGAGALALMTEQETLCRSVGDAAGVARALAGQGAVLGDMGDVAGAAQRYAAFRAVAEESGDLRSMAEAGISEAVTLRQLGQREEAAERASAAEALVRRLGDEPLLARALDAQARAAVDEGRWADASRLATEAVLFARSSGAVSVLLLALGMLGTARRELGDLAGARAAHLEEEAGAGRLGDSAAEAGARVNLASVDIAAGDLTSALGRYAAAEPVFRRQNTPAMLTVLYANRAQVHAHLGNAPAAIDDLIAGGRAAAAWGSLLQSQQMLTQAIEMLYAAGRMAEAEPLWTSVADVSRALGDETSLQRALGERATIVLGRGDSVTAGALFDEQESICRRIGDQAGLAACVGNRAILLRHAGDLPGALRCIDEQVELSRAGNNGQGVLFATANRGEVLALMGRVAEGLAALREARAMATAWNLAPMVQELDRMIAEVVSSQ